MKFVRLILFAAILSFSNGQTTDYFSKDNNQAIRDSLNMIKFVNPNKAVRFAFEILEKYPVKNPNRVQGAAYAALGQIYHIKGLTGPTIEYLDLAEKIFYEVLGQVPPWLQIDIGNVYFAQGLYDKATESYQRSYENFKSISDNDDIKLNPAGRSDKLAGMAVSKNNLALISIQLKEFDKAEALYIEGKALREQRNQYDDLAHSYLSLADLFLRSGKSSKVPIYCDSAEQMVERLFDSENEQYGAFEENANRYIGMSKQYLAEYYFKLKNKKLMFNYLREAKDYYAELPIELSTLLNISAIMHSKFEDHAQALYDLNEGLLIANKQGLNRAKKQLLKTKKDILSQINNQSEIEKTNEILLLLNQEEVASQNRELLIHMELRNQLRAGQEALKEAREDRRQFIALAILVFFILGLIISMVRNEYITAQQQQLLAEQSKAVAELELKSTERELRQVSTSIMEKNEMIESIKKDINYASKFLSDSESKYLLSPLRTKLKDATTGSTDWEEFQLHFNKTYPGFLEHLANLNKSLTIPDLRLCAYLRSGQTTKEIAKMTGLSVRSIESRRYRLRKKLELDRDTTLYKFIQQIGSRKNVT